MAPHTLKPPPLLTALTLGLLLSACAAAESPSGVPSTAGAAAPAASASPPANSPDRPAAAPGTGGRTQKSEAGQVTIEVTWPGAEAGPVFKVVMDTHAVELDGYDLRQLAVLRTDGGREVRPTGWDAPKGGHHREGLLTFPAELDGRPLFAPGRSVELIIRDVAGIAERTFPWTA